MSKKSTVKETIVPAMFTKTPGTTTITDPERNKENKSKSDRLVPWVEK